MDTFEDVRKFTPGAFVVVRLSDTAQMAGVVQSVDHEHRALSFTDGRQIKWDAPPATETPAEEPEKE